MPACKHIAVFGAGIAGLTVAHELARLGYSITVFEANATPGGFFRSARSAVEGNMPTEYSWHGMGPWYYNVFDLMKQIPFDESGSVYDKALSRPIDFGIFPDAGTAHFFDGKVRNIPGMFRMSSTECARWFWLMLKTWTANRRTEKLYSALNAAQHWKPLLSDQAYRAWRASFGPWIGSDWTNVSLHHAGQFFRKQLLGKTVHRHPEDECGPAWFHGPRDGWLLLRGPSSEFWFEPWTEYLAGMGVDIHYQAPLYRLAFDGARIAGAFLESGELVRADAYVLAASPFSIADVIDRTPELRADAELGRFRPLVQDGPHTQVSFRIAFSEPIHFPRERTAVVVADSSFNITLFAQEQAWKSWVDKGAGIASLWTATACVASEPGPLFGRPLAHCTKDEFIEEVKTQILACKSLDALIQEANGGRHLRDFPMVRIEVWHEWRFSHHGIEPEQPKWVTTTHTQPYLPQQRTGISNLFLAGAHTRTQADVWSIEGAVESGRRAGQGIDRRVQVISQYKPLWLRLVSLLDDICYACGAPHVLDVAVLLLLLAAGLMIAGQFSPY